MDNEPEIPIEQEVHESKTFVIYDGNCPRATKYALALHKTLNKPTHHRMQIPEDIDVWCNELVVYVQSGQYRTAFLNESIGIIDYAALPEQQRLYLKLPCDGFDGT